jgi:3-oxoadipate enol-lactonase
MPRFKPSPDLDMHYEVDDFTDPWTQLETVLLLHGNAESGLAWWRWVPKLSRHYRVVRPDMRGFGQSSPMPREFPWTLDRLVEDFCLLMDHLGIDRFHLIGAKIGGTVARAFAARRPERVNTLTVVGSPPPFRAEAAANVGATVKMFKDYGVEYWARQNMANRLGSTFPKEGFDFWVKYMARTALSTQLGFMPTIAVADIRADIPNIKCPTLVITTEESGLGSVASMRAWQEQIAGSELVVFPGNSYHVAATHAEEAADATLDFLKRRG